MDHTHHGGKAASSLALTDGVAGPARRLLGAWSQPLKIYYDDDYPLINAWICPIIFNDMLLRHHPGCYVAACV